MNYICGNVKVTDSTVEYILFNEKNKTRTRITATHEDYLEMVDKFSLKSASPLEVVAFGGFEFSEIDFNDFSKPEFERYKFRAECNLDVLNVINELIPHAKFKVEFQTSSINPEVIIQGERLDRDDILTAMRKVSDSHVMVQTLQLESDYTGERDYNLI